MPGNIDKLHRRPKPSDGGYHKWTVALPAQNGEAMIEFKESSEFIWLNGDQRSKLRFEKGGNSFAMVGGQRIDLVSSKAWGGRKTFKLYVGGCVVEDIGSNGAQENFKGMPDGEYVINTSPKRGSGGTKGRKGGSSVGWRRSCGEGEEEVKSVEERSRVKEDDFDDELSDEEEESDEDNEDEYTAGKENVDATPEIMPRGVERISENQYSASIKTPSNKFQNLGTFESVRKAESAYLDAANRYRRKL